MPCPSNSASTAMAWATNRLIASSPSSEVFDSGARCYSSNVCLKDRARDMVRDVARDAPLVGLFVTCLVDLFRPSVGFAAIKLLERGGARVEVPLAQTCCGQPAFNSGDREDAAAIARQVVD